MEYIPRPFCSPTPPIDVPLLDDVKFQLPQPGEFPDFEGLHGIEMPPSQQISPEALATLIQSRLFFGLLTEFLGYTPELTQFSEIKEEGGEVVQYVRMDKISEVFISRRHPVSARLSWINLEATSEWLDRLEGLPAAHSHPVPKVALSTRILVEALYLYTEVQTGEVVCEPTFRRLNSFHDRNAPPSLRIIFQRLQENSWCPSRISYLCATRRLGYLDLFYMSQIPRNHPHNLDHRACSGLACTATNLQREPIDRPRHLRRNCTCRLLRVPMEKVMENLQKGVISLVRVIRDDSDGLSLQIEPAKINSRYVAISHVWSDGMGNAFENGLFSCQLEHISQCISQLPVHGREAMSTTALDRIENPIPTWGPLLHLTQKWRPIDMFWLDTLCIPAKFAPDRGPNHKEMRQIAISLIAAVFAGATRVLVLDAEMQKVRRSASSTSEIFARLLGCNWASRAWTFQETQSLRCSVQLQDGAFDPRDSYLPFRDWRAFRFQQNADFWQAWQRLSTHVCRKADFTGFLEHRLFEEFQLILSITWFREIYELVDSVERPRYDEHQWRGLYHYLARLVSDHNDQGYLRGSETLIFTYAWNQLMVRSSTDVDDIVLILAMSLQLPVYEILQKPVDERLKSIIWYVKYAPKSFFFLPHSQLQTGPKELDRWVPPTVKALNTDNASPFVGYDPVFDTYLRVCSLKRTISMRFPLSCDSSGPYQIFIMIIPDTLPNVPQISLIYRNKEYVIRFHRSENSQLSLDSFHRTVLVVDLTLTGAENTGPSRTWVAGCCLREISDIETSSQNSAGWDMNVLYDCAISVASKITQNDCVATNVPQTSVLQTKSPSLRSDDMTVLYVEDRGTNRSPGQGLERFANFRLACEPPKDLTLPLRRRVLFRPAHWTLLTLSGITLLLMSGISIICIVPFANQQSISNSAFNKELAITLITRFIAGPIFALGWLIYLSCGVVMSILSLFRKTDSKRVRAYWKNCAMHFARPLEFFLNEYFPMVAFVLGILMLIVAPLASFGLSLRLIYKDATSMTSTMASIQMAVSLANVMVAIINGAFVFLWSQQSRRLWLFSFSQNLVTASSRSDHTRELWEKAANGELIANLKFMWRFDDMKREKLMPFE